ncbi:Putative retroelement [Phytophthora palmivora]|uniref:Retroelement n=1 Tax=Phytophthora palmivora TaxID=4796 RepID=A0A2P4Y3M4_9STRA|nr:Putative retroelement [Phytophthora palmivora]
MLVLTTKKPRLTERERGRIEGLHLAGACDRDIARVTSRSRDTVSRVIAQPTPKTPKRSGPRPVLGDREVRRLIRTAAKGDLSAYKLKSELDLAVSVRTIQRILARVDWLVCAKMENVLPLKPEDMLARKAWANEKKWNLDGPDGFQHYWQDLRKPPRQTRRRQAGGGSVMVWAAFSSRGKSLVVLNGRQNSDDYVYAVSEYLILFAHLNYGIHYIYQQDNASIHVSKCTKAFFAEQDVKVLDWPSKSPDLNPIENLWSIMSRRVYSNGKQFESVLQLKTALYEAWGAIPIVLLVSLIESMPRRCIEVVDRKGNRTHY